jgi:protein associated with RNAse G/E
VDAIRVRFEKWGRRPHWQYDAVRLGADDHGTWLGLPPGTAVARPGRSFVTDQRQVVLVPRSGAFVATFYAPEADPPCAVYVDISTPPVDSGDSVSAVDLDLDVVRGRTGRVWVDDEDEFAVHQTRFGYPDEVVALAVRSCDEVLAAVVAASPPYDAATAPGWLAKLETAMMQP